MLRIIASRLATLPVMLLGVVLLLFFVTHLIPADPARVAVGPNASQEAVEAMRERMGLNDPLLVQLGTYLKQLVRLDLGDSIYDKQPVVDSLRRYAPATIELALVAAFLMIVTGVSLGIFAATSNSRIAVQLTRLGTIAGRAVPAFWLAMLLQFFFYSRLSWFPSGGRLNMYAHDPPRSITGLYLVDSALTLNGGVFVDAAHHLVLPALALAIGGTADVMRMTRAQILSEMRHDYTRSARAKGLSDRTVLLRHVLPNAMSAVLTLIGIRVGYLLAGAVLVESIFNWPGLGRYSLDAIQNFDFQALTGVTLLVTTIFLVINLIVDLISLALDPRARGRG
jgi:ABC-type dipeptide/oligopeptide/nickel transport system permease component